MRFFNFSAVLRLLVSIMLCAVCSMPVSASAANSILNRGNINSGIDLGSDVALRTLTLKRMDEIQAALNKYAMANNLIPCPSVSTDTSTTVGGAVATGNPAIACAGDSAGTSTNSNIVAGMVPVRTLNLPSEYIYDAWGRRFVYVIDRRFAHKGDLATSEGVLSSTTLSSYNSTRTGNLEVYDKVGAGQQRVDGGANNGPAGVLISYGPNGYGGYTKNGQRIPYSSASSDELENIFASSSSADVKFVQRAPDLIFDDIVYLVQRSDNVLFMCPDRGTLGGAITTTISGAGYGGTIQWKNDSLNLGIPLPLDTADPAQWNRTMYQGCYGGKVDPVTGTFQSCATGTCYTGYVSRVCRASLSSDAAVWDVNASGSSCKCPAQTIAAGNYWYSGSSWPEASPTITPAPGNAITPPNSCNSAFYTGTITRYCRGDDSTALSGGWSTTPGTFTASTSSNYGALSKNCLCKSKSVSAGTGYNAFTIPAGTAVGSSYAKTCDAVGYSGTVNFQCNDQSGYNPTVSSGACIANCPALTGNTSGNQYANWSSTTANSNNVAGSCKAGLVTSAAGQPYRSCSSTGTWGGITDRFLPVSSLHTWHRI